MKTRKIFEIPVRWVALADFQDEPGIYGMSFGFDPQPIARSIEAVGLINAPLVERDSRGRVEIVSGYRRIMALKRLGWKKVPCKDISGAAASQLDLFLVGLHENLSTRPFNTVEKAMVLSRLSTWMPEDEIIELYMPLLGLPRHRPTFQIYTALERGLDTRAKLSLAGGRLSLKAAGMLLDTDEKSRKALIEWIINLNLNFNQQLQFIDMILDLSYNNKCPIPAVLEDDPFKSFISDRPLNLPQRAKALMREIRKLCFPRLAAAERSFKATLSRLNLPDGVALQAPAYFEAPDYLLQVRFKKGRELREKLRALSEMTEMDQLGDPWEETD